MLTKGSWTRRWEHESGRFVPVAPTLDAFVASTGATKSKAKAAEPVIVERSNRDVHASHEHANTPVA